FKGQVTTSSLNAFGAPTSVNYYVDSAAVAANTPALTIVNSYNSLGQTTSIDDPQDGTVQFGYDSNGRLTSMASPQGTINYKYDPTTGMLLQTSTDSTDITYTYNSLY